MRDSNGTLVQIGLGTSIGREYAEFLLAYVMVAMRKDTCGTMTYWLDPQNFADRDMHGKESVLKNVLKCFEVHIPGLSGSKCILNLTPQLVIVAKERHGTTYEFPRLLVMKKEQLEQVPI